jgi:hypothetical protein
MYTVKFKAEDMRIPWNICKVTSCYFILISSQKKLIIKPIIKQILMGDYFMQKKIKNLVAVRSKMADV